MVLVLYFPTTDSLIDTLRLLAAFLRGRPALAQPTVVIEAQGPRPAEPSLPGSGPIVIGWAAGIDYSGTEAIRALREEGYRVILINSKPVTIMTDPDVADATYIEPITLLSGVVRAPVR